MPCLIGAFYWFTLPALLALNFQQKCETKYETQYDTQCHTEYRTEYETIYEEKCEQKYVDKVKSLQILSLNEKWF